MTAAEAPRPELDDRTLSFMLGAAIAARGMMRTAGTSEEIASSVLNQNLEMPFSLEQDGITMQVAREYATRLAAAVGLQVVVGPQLGGEV